MLSSHERQSWEDIRRQLEADPAEPVRLGRTRSFERTGDLPGVDDLPAAVVGGLWTTIFLVLFGAVAAGLAVGALTVLGWMAWRWWADSRPTGEDPAGPAVTDPGR